MDVRCRHCGEPWDMDSLHDMPESYESKYNHETKRNPGYEKASELFRIYGCGFFDHAWNDLPLKDCMQKVVDQEKADKARLVYAITNDMDFAGSVLGD